MPSTFHPDVIKAADMLISRGYRLKHPTVRAKVSRIENSPFTIHRQEVTMHKPGKIKPEDLTDLKNIFPVKGEHPNAHFNHSEQAGFNVNQTENGHEVKIHGCDLKTK